jgi:hypothetical protein
MFERLNFSVFSCFLIYIKKNHAKNAASEEKSGFCQWYLDKE